MLNEKYDEQEIFKVVESMKKDDNFNYHEIASRLNQMGWRSKQGLPFSGVIVSKIAVKFGMRIKAPYKRRTLDSKNETPEPRPMKIIQKCFKSNLFSDDEMQFIIDRIGDKS